MKTAAFVLFADCGICLGAAAYFLVAVGWNWVNPPRDPWQSIAQILNSVAYVCWGAALIPFAGLGLVAGIGALLRGTPGSWVLVLPFTAVALPIGLLAVVVAFGPAYDPDYLLVSLWEAGWGLLQIVASVLAVAVAAQSKRAAAPVSGEDT
jgi:hypothetical protein